MLLIKLKISDNYQYWRHVQLRAYEEDQKYKEGKFIIERSYLKPIGQNSEKYWAPDQDSDDEQAILFSRLLAG